MQGDYRFSFILPIRAEMFRKIPDHDQSPHSARGHSLLGGAAMLRDFRDFLFKQNALALAIGVIIGAAMAASCSRSSPTCSCR